MNHAVNRMQQKFEVLLRDRKIDALKILELQDNLVSMLAGRINLPKLLDQPRRKDDAGYLAIAATVGTLAELAALMGEHDLPALVAEVDRAWRKGIQTPPVRDIPELSVGRVASRPVMHETPDTPCLART